MPQFKRGLSRLKDLGQTERVRASLGPEQRRREIHVEVEIGCEGASYGSCDALILLNMGCYLRTEAISVFEYLLKVDRLSFRY